MKGIRVDFAKLVICIQQRKETILERPQNTSNRGPMHRYQGEVVDLSAYRYCEEST